MIRTPRLLAQVESLEDRSVPAIFGQPWLDGRHLTISFAGDGTLVSGVGSSLGAVFSPLGSDSAKLEVLRAFQTWATNANLNIGLVADSNWAFGTAGAIQGDPRFGDIRVGARVMAGDVVAVTAPFSLLTPNSGDLILNSAKAFSLGAANGYDLFTIALQESGHAFGLGNSVDSASVMFEQYNLPRTELTGGDVSSIQQLYGARAADTFEGAGGNDTTSTASVYSGVVEADLTTSSDVDVYRYTATSSDARWFRIKAAGLSLVAAKLEVVDSTGQVIGSAQANNPLQNDVTVYVSQLVSGATYYLRVSSARSDVFGIGGYRLAIDSTATGPAAANPYALIDAETSANNTIATATAVTPSAGPFSYSFRSTLKSALDVDYFKVHSPSNGSSNLLVTVSAVGESWFTPDVDIYSTTGVKLSAKIVAQTDSFVVLSLEGAAANTDYLVRVASIFHEAGNYDFVADFRAANLPAMMGAKGTLDSLNRTTSATLTIYRSQTIQLNLLANLQNGADMLSLVRIYDSQNRIVFEMFSITELLSTGQVFLNRGVYRIEVQSLTAAVTNFSLTLFGVTDPIGSESTDPTSDPAGDPVNVGDPPPPPPPDDTTTIVIAPPPILPPTIVWF